MLTFLWETFHFIEFAILYLLLVIAFKANNRYTEMTDLLAMIISILYAFIDEIHQFYVPGRSFSQMDLFKDMIGVVTAWVLIGRFYLNPPPKEDQNKTRSKKEG